MTPADTLRVRLDSPGIIVAPGVSDGLSAQMAAEAGFDVLYMTGAGVSLGTFGTPAVGLLTLTEMAAACVDAGLIWVGPQPTSSAGWGRRSKRAG